MENLKEDLVFPQETKIEPTTGTAGLRTQVPGISTTVSSLSSATGGIEPGNLVEQEIG